MDPSCVDEPLELVLVPGEAEAPFVEATQSFEAFFEAESRVLFRRLCVITGNGHEAEEIMQDAFLALWERWDRVAGVDDPTGYLYRTAMNVFRKRYRRTRLALRRSFVAAEEIEPFAGIDERQDLISALASISPRQRAALVLTDILGYSSEETAKILGVKAATVRGLASRGREALRQTVGDRA
jgi:RNA polymerase sigma factor (sigma-70 family)